MSGAGVRTLLAVGSCVALLAGCTSAPGTSEPEGPASSDATAQPTLEYVALGDSFTAAPGIGEADLSDGCQRSSRNYPALVAEQLEETRDVELVDRSCIGADTTDLAGRQPAGGDTLPPQLRALSSDTDLVTLSMGGNDFTVFLQLVAGCLAVVEQDPGGSPCRDSSRAQGHPWRQAQPRIEQRLVDAVSEIRRRASDAQVLLVGYPQLPPDEGDCPGRMPLATGDIPFARKVNKALSDNLRRAAERTGAAYVDVWSASAGHDICSDEPWTNGQQSAPSGAIPFHPLPAGQAAVADLVVDAFDE